MQDMKLRQIVTMGSVDTLEQKTVTLCYATDFVNVTFINFCCTRRDIAQVSLNSWRWDEQASLGVQLASASGEAWPYSAR